MYRMACESESGLESERDVSGLESERDSATVIGCQRMSC